MSSIAADLPAVSFPPQRREALRRLQLFLPRAGHTYRKQRNVDLGPNEHRYVSQLSPYIGNGLLATEEVVASVLRAHSFADSEKFLQEVFWRVYWKGYLANRAKLWTNYQADLQALGEGNLDHPDYAAATSGDTSIDCFNTWVRELVETGYLHNHARMWFASIWIFTLKLPWQLGADFFLRHLLDGNPASNTLSWRWVAGLHTKGKAYLARSDNIERCTAGRFQKTDGLARETHPIEEQHPEVTPTFAGRPNPPAQLEHGQGLLLLDEDLGKHIPNIDTASHVLALYPEHLSGQSRTSRKVRVFRKRCLEETVRRLRSETGCQIELTTTPSGAEISEWAGRNKLSSLLLAQPQIGPWTDAWAPIARDLTQRGIVLHTFRPWWENELFPQATHGFFKFKKGIRFVAEQMYERAHG